MNITAVRYFFPVLCPPEDIIYVYSWNNNELHFNYSNLFNQHYPCGENYQQTMIFERYTYISVQSVFSRSQ